MKFRILGPFEVAQDASNLVTPTGPLGQALLTRLILARGDVIPGERLVDEFWPSLPPTSQRRSLRYQIWSIRKSIEPERTTGSDHGIISREGAGYRLRIEGHYLDALAFERSLDTARELRTSSQKKALAALERGLRLWRGAPLSHVLYEQFAQADIHRLNAMRVSAEVLRIDLMLATGRWSEATVELEGLTTRTPEVERFWCQLIDALTLEGRTTEALAKFGEAQSKLNAGTGFATSDELRASYERALSPDPRQAEGRLAVVRG